MSRPSLHFPVISEGAEYLVMGHLMRRNILAYKAPPGNEGYDLICIYPDPRRRPGPRELAQVRVQVKSRYPTGARSFPVKAASLDAFDFLIATFLNIGNFNRGKDGIVGARETVFYTLPPDFIRQRHHISGGWEKVSLSGLSAEVLAPYKNEAGFELIAQALGVARPARPADAPTSEDEDIGADP